MADYIDRQAVVDVICDMHIGGKDGVANALSNTYGADLREIIEQIDSLPSADVQPVRHGKWIKAQRKGIISYADGYAECNKCHEVSYLGWNDKYCRNCGARMDGEQNATD